MNPVDHPNGGRTKGGKHWATPWGKPTKGYKTRKNKHDGQVHHSRRVRRRSKRDDQGDALWHAQSGKARSSTATF